MPSADSLTREEMETLLPYRLSEAAILGAKAQVARAKANRLREEWRAQSELSRRLAREAGKIGLRDHYRGPEFVEAFGRANMQSGFARDRERLYVRAEKEAQALERAQRRARAAEARGVE